MSITPPDYILEEQKARRANAEELRNNLNDASVLHKIQCWAERHSLEFEFVRYKVLTDDAFALHFAKEPSRQSLHQKVAAAHIQKNIPLVRDFKSLAAGGRNALYVVNGMIIEADRRQSISAQGKSIDFTWNFECSGKVLSAYATHKHTKDEGGSQDNQYEDLISFLKSAEPSRDINAIFFAICDGPYYRRHERLRTLRENHQSFRRRVCPIDELPKYWGLAIEEWLMAHNLTAAPDTKKALELLKQ
jgi:hypothetical protein